MSEIPVATWIEQIKSAYLAGDVTIAHSMLIEAMDDTSNAPQLLEIAGILAYREKEYRQSVELIERAMFEIPLSISAQMTLANAWLILGKNEKATVAIEFLVDQVHRVPCSMLWDLTNATIAIGRDDWAVEICAENKRRHPDDSRAVFGIGYHIWQAGRELRVAKAHIERAIEMNPDCEMYRFQLTNLLIDMGDDDAAYQQIKEISLDSLAKFYCGARHEEIRLLLRSKQDFLRLVTILTVHGTGEEATQ